MYFDRIFNHYFSTLFGTWVKFIKYFHVTYTTNLLRNSTYVLFSITIEEQNIKISKLHE